MGVVWFLLDPSGHHVAAVGAFSRSFLRAVFLAQRGHWVAWKHCLWKQALHTEHLLHVAVWNGKMTAELRQNSQMKPLPWHSSHLATCSRDALSTSLSEDTSSPFLTLTRSSSEKRWHASVRWLGSCWNTCRVLRRGNRGRSDPVDRPLGWGEGRHSLPLGHFANLSIQFYFHNGSEAS